MNIPSHQRLYDQGHTPQVAGSLSLESHAPILRISTSSIPKVARPRPPRKSPYPSSPQLMTQSAQTAFLTPEDLLSTKSIQNGSSNAFSDTYPGSLDLSRPHSGNSAATQTTWSFVSDKTAQTKSFTPLRTKGKKDPQRRKRTKMEPILVSSACRECITRCRGGKHQVLDKKWFELLADVAAKRAKEKEPPKDDDWVLLEHVARRIQHWCKEKTEAVQVSVFVVLLKKEYRHHLAECQSHCIHATHKAQINIRFSDGSLERQMKDSALAEQPLSKQFSSICEILETEWESET